MGLSIYMHVDCHAIDDERWEAAYLTSLQLLERFPGPLASCVREDIGSLKRWVVTTSIVRDVDSPDERWQIDRELGSGRSAESFSLYRHLKHYRQKRLGAKGRQSESAPDILRPKTTKDGAESEWYDFGGSTVFDSKTQGYPYHYAVLAVGMLLESSFPRHALVRGDFTRRQCEQTAEWISSILGRRVPLPVLVDGPRLWSRLLEAFPDFDQEAVIQRFRNLLEGGHETVLRALDEVGADPQAVRRVFLRELDHYQSLNQIGARSLIRALCNVDGDIDRAIDWACGARDAGAELGPGQQPLMRHFQPEELLQALCASFITVPPYEREVLQSLRASPDSLSNFEETFGQILLLMSGMPTAVDCYIEEEQLLAEFVRRWPEKLQQFSQILRQSLEHVHDVRGQLHQLTERLEQRAERACDTEPVWKPSNEDLEYQLGAEFIQAEIERQHEAVPKMEDAARELGQQMQQALLKNSALQKFLAASDRQKTLEQLYRASFENGIEMPEDIWRELDSTQDLNVLRALLLLVMCPEREVQFWRCREHLLQSPDLWHLLAGQTL